MVVASLGDNIAEVLATDAGRARDHDLNTLCRRSVGEQLFWGLSWRRRYLRSSDNPSDDDSRLADDQLIRPGRVFHGEGVRRVLNAQLPQTGRRGHLRPSGPCFLELFAGCARLSSAVCDTGLRTGIPFQNKYAPCFDVSKKSVAATVASCMRDGPVWGILIAIPCTLDSVAGQRVDRTEEELRSREVLVSNVPCLLRLAIKHTIYFDIENPWASKLWRRPMLRKLVRRAGAERVGYTECGYLLVLP